MGLNIFSHGKGSRVILENDPARGGCVQEVLQLSDNIGENGGAGVGSHMQYR